MRTVKSRHAKIVQWSDEDGCFVGTCPSFFGGGVHGKDELKVYRELCQVVAEWEAYEKKQRRTSARGGKKHQEHVGL